MLPKISLELHRTKLIPAMCMRISYQVKQVCVQITLPLISRHALPLARLHQRSPPAGHQTHTLPMLFFLSACYRSALTLIGLNLDIK